LGANLQDKSLDLRKNFSPVFLDYPVSKSFAKTKNKKLFLYGVRNSTSQKNSRPHWPSMNLNRSVIHQKNRPPRPQATKMPGDVLPIDVRPRNIQGALSNGG
jgi:hypothetical protein